MGLAGLAVLEGLVVVAEDWNRGSQWPAVGETRIRQEESLFAGVAETDPDAVQETPWAAVGGQLDSGVVETGAAAGIAEAVVETEGSVVEIGGSVGTGG